MIESRAIKDDVARGDTTIEERRSFEARTVAAYGRADASRILDALGLAISRSGDTKRASGLPAWTHDLRVALILIDLGMDADSVVAGLLHDLDEEKEGEVDESQAARPLPVALSPKPPAPKPPAQKLPAQKTVVPKTTAAKAGAKGQANQAAKALALNLRPELDSRYGSDVAHIVAGVSRLATLRAKNRSVHAAEGIRKMLFAMTADIRVIIVKLADKLDSMRSLRWLTETRQKEIASECLDIYAPLADRLGVSWVKDELEDLALKHLNREAFDQIKDIVAEKKGERELFLSRVEEAIREAARADAIEVEVRARAKHFYSIYQKMRKKAKSADELFDLFGVRLVCATENDCYALVGLVHRLWKPLEGRFKDYIAMPKANGYRSLHTTVMCYEGRLLEVQIRTREMHHLAEYGVASHWLYKKGSTAEVPRPEELGLVNRLKEWSSFAGSGAEFLEAIKRELLKDSIFVFTPQGDVIELPIGAGPLDFAFAIHSDVGLHCVGAKADGQIVPLDGELSNTQVVEILTTPAAHPTMNWLSLAKTTKARTKIRSWLVQSGQVLAIEKNIVAGKKSPAGQVHPEAQTAAHQAQAAETLPKTEVEIRSGGVTQRPEEGVIEYRDWAAGEAVRNEKAGVAIGGARGLVIRIAGCCRPVTGDPIAGYVSRGRGIIVHRADCRTLAAIPDFGERGIEVHWEAMTPFVTARFRLTARRSADLFSEIEAAVRKFRGHLREGKLGERGDGAWEGSFTMEVEKAEDVEKVIRSVRSVPAVLTIERKV
ncbi:MAG: RelA/SpoT family protein [Treponema sp.]|nr:RelA/SpoT family protein [Treponema sp.]